MRMQEPKFIREHYMLARMQYKIAGGCGKVDIDSVMSFKEARKKFIMEQPEFEALGNVINMTPTDFIRSQRP